MNDLPILIVYRWAKNRILCVHAVNSAAVCFFKILSYKNYVYFLIKALRRIACFCFLVFLYTDLNGRKYPLFGEHPVFYYCYHRFTLYRFLLLRIYAMTALTRAYLRIFLDLISAGV